MNLRNKEARELQKTRLSCGFMKYGSPGKSSRVGRPQADQAQLMLVLQSLGLTDDVDTVKSSSEEQSVLRIDYLVDTDNDELLRAMSTRPEPVWLDHDCSSLDDWNNRVCMCSKAEVTFDKDVRAVGPERLDDFREHQPHTVKQIYRIGTAPEGHVWHREPQAKGDEQYIVRK